MMEIHGTIHFGFLCWGADETCLRSRMNEINENFFIFTTSIKSVYLNWFSACLHWR